MADAKILDLDKVRPPERKIRLGGREYALARRTFGSIRRFRAANEAVRAAAGNEAATEAAIMDLLRCVVPDADEALLDQLDTSIGLERLANFWAGADEEEAAQAAADPTSPG